MMNKEAIERTKARVKNELKPVLTNGLEMARLEMQLMLDRNQQLFNQVKNRNHMLNDYTTNPVVSSPYLDIWEPLTPRQYIYVALGLISVAAFFLWVAK